MQGLVFMALADAVSHVIRSDAAEESGLFRRERAVAGWPAGNGTRVIPGGPDGRLVVEDRVVGVPQRHGIWAVVDVGRAVRALYVGMASFAVVGVGCERSDPAAVLAGHVVPVAEVHWPLDEVTHSAIMLHAAVCQDEGSGSPSGSPANRCSAVWRAGHGPPHHLAAMRRAGNRYMDFDHQLSCGCGAFPCSRCPARESILRKAAYGGRSAHMTVGHPRRCRAPSRS